MCAIPLSCASGTLAAQWIDVPAMMRVVLSTPLVLDRLNRGTRPYNFLLCPLVDTVVGYPRSCPKRSATFSVSILAIPSRNRWHRTVGIRRGSEPPAVQGDGVSSHRKRSAVVTVCVILRSDDFLMC